MNENEGHFDEVLEVFDDPALCRIAAMLLGVPGAEMPEAEGTQDWRLRLKAIPDNLEDAEREALINGFVDEIVNFKPRKEEGPRGFAQVESSFRDMLKNNANALAE